MNFVFEHCSVPYIGERLLLAAFSIVVAAGCGGEAASEADRRQSAPPAQRSPIDPEARVLLQQGLKAFRQHDFRAALAWADSVEQHSPHLPGGHLLRGKAYTSMMRFDEAEAAYSKALALDPEYQSAWKARADNAFRQADFEEAARLYRRALKARPTASAWSGLGQAYLEVGKVDSARQALEQSLTADSTHAPAHLTLALLYKNEGQLRQALRHAREALRLEKEDPKHHYQVGQLLVQTGRNKEALPHLRATAEEWPWHYGAQYNLGQALGRLGQQKRAQKRLQNAEELRSLQNQVQSVKTSIRAEPYNPLLHARLGLVLRRAERYEEAMHAYTMAARQAPQNLDITNDLANLHLMQENPAEAVPLYLRILGQDSTRVSAWMNLGIAYAMVGRPEEAQRAWENVLKYEPGHPKARAFLERVKQGSL